MNPVVYVSTIEEPRKADFVPRNGSTHRKPPTMSTQTPTARFQGIDQQAQPGKTDDGFHWPTIPDRLLKMDEVQELTTLGRTTIYAKIKTGEFPEPVRLSERAVAWRETEVREWIKGLARAGLTNLEA